MALKVRIRAERIHGNTPPPPPKTACDMPKHAPLSRQQVKLDGKTVKPDELERLGKAAAGDGLTGKLTLTAAAPLILPEDDTKVCAASGWILLHAASSAIGLS